MIGKKEIDAFVAYWSAQNGAERSQCHPFWDSLLGEVGIRQQPSAPREGALDRRLELRRDSRPRHGRRPSRGHLRDDSAKIVEGNALRMDWETAFSDRINRIDRIEDAEENPVNPVNPVKTSFDYIMGNPPFIGARMMSQNSEQKREIEELFGDIKDVQDRPYVGAEEFINAKKRYCLWLKKATPLEIARSEFLSARVAAVRDFRLASKAKMTNGYAKVPHLFAQLTQPDDVDYLIIPRVSSERRRYIPIGYEKGDVITAIPRRSCTIRSRGPRRRGRSPRPTMLGRVKVGRTLRVRRNSRSNAPRRQSWMRGKSMRGRPSRSFTARRCISSPTSSPPTRRTTRR